LSHPWISSDGDHVRLTVRVQPRASRTEVAGLHGDSLKIRLASPPVDGAANRELIAFIARRLRRPKSSITLERGARARRKTLCIKNIELDSAVAALWPDPV